jgi:DNA-binding CsgD family transcriptional regulator
MSAYAEGLLLIGPSNILKYANDEAAQILAYPRNPQAIKSLNSFLADKVQSVLPKGTPLPQSGLVTEVMSGKRRYHCRAFPLVSTSKGSNCDLSIIVLIERFDKVAFNSFRYIEKFRLTQREGEIVTYLLDGLTNKEIASRMKISPNTVKAFLRLVMVKTGTSTRSGIVGKILDASQ